MEAIAWSGVSCKHSLSTVEGRGLGEAPKWFWKVTNDRKAQLVEAGRVPWTGSLHQRGDASEESSIP